MSTRANILIQELGKSIWVYHHWDGYPEYLGAKIMKLLVEKADKYSEATDIANIMFHDKDDDGFELTSGRHGDIEYLYHINTDTKEITCYATPYNEMERQLEKQHWDDQEQVEKWFKFCKAN